MAWANYEEEIEDQVVTRLLLGGNSVFEVERFYESVSPEELLDFIHGRVSTSPAAFIRCEGLDGEGLSTLGEIQNATYTLTIIVASPNFGKVRQISGEKRKVNTTIANLMSRLTGFMLDLTGQPDQPLVFRSLKDMFTSKAIDARMLTFEIQGVPIDFSA